MPHTPEEHPPARRTRRHREKGAPSTRVSGRLRGAPAKMDISTTPPSPDREKARRVETSVNRASGPSLSLKSSQSKEVPERLQGDMQRRAENEDVASSTSIVGAPQKLQIDQKLSDAESSSIPSQYNKPLPPVPSDAASLSVDRHSSGHTSTLTILRDTADEHGIETDTTTTQHLMIERRASISSESICSPEHQSDQDGQHSLFPSLSSPHSRSPRKRQSADEEVLKGLPEDSPSAKVLRKLPGRLVTVVEDKEPKRRRRGECGSGGVPTEGSSEETEQAESSQDTIPLSPVQSPNEKSLIKSPSASPPETQQGQEQASPSSLTNSGRGYHPYSPTHHSPDMPVLRNLPVRRRLETESRMAAQLGEQFLIKGRGLDRRAPLSPKKQESISSKDGSSISNVASDANVIYFSPGKRKRGRPPKMSPKPQEPPEQDIPVTAKSTSDEQSPPQSPKRKRGRPRKDSTTNAVDSGKPENEASCHTSLSSTSQECLSAENLNSHSSSLGPLTVPSVPECSIINSEAYGVFELFKTADSPQSPKTDTQNSQFNTPSPQTHCLISVSQTSTVEPSNDQTDLKATAPNSVSPDLSLEALPQIQTENAAQSNTNPLSQLPAPTPSEGFAGSSSRPTTECITTSTSSVCQNSQVTTISSELSTLSDKGNASEMSLKSMPIELLEQPKLENNILGASPLLPSVSDQTFAQTCQLEKAGRVSVPDLTQSSIQPDIPQETTFKLNQTNVLSQPKPELTQTAPTYSSQIPIAPISSPNSLEMASDSPKQSPASRQSTGPVEEQRIDNQQDPSTPNEHGLIESTEEMHIDISEKSEQAERDNSQSKAKKRKMENLPEDRGSATLLISETLMQTTPVNVVAHAQLEEESQTKNQECKSTDKKRNICRQSSQESVRSSSPSSVSSSGTHSSQSKKSAESSIPAKRKRMERDSEKVKASDQEPVKPESQCCSSSDSEDSTGQERRLTRSSLKSLEKESTSDKGDKNSNGRRRSDKKVTKELESTASTPVRVTRKSIGSQPFLKLTSPNSSEPEVLGKRCSALNAAAKLLAMRGKGPDPPSSSTKSKGIQGQQSTPEKISKPKGKQDQDFPKTNSVVNKTECSRQTPTCLTDSPPSTTGTGHTASRSTRQRPGNLVPPLETEVKRVKKEEKKKNPDQKEEAEEENRETRSSRGHSACSSVSSERGAGSSRSRSSSNSSQCTRSLSSRSTGPPHSHSRAPSSGSDTEKGKGWQKKTGENRGRESRRERHSQNNEKPEPSAGSNEGTPDRVLRSVAALAAAQARTPASNTRSSSSQQRQSKT